MVLVSLCLLFHDLLSCRTSLQKEKCFLMVSLNEILNSCYVDRTILFFHIIVCTNNYKLMFTSFLKN